MCEALRELMKEEIEEELEKARKEGNNRAREEGRSEGRAEGRSEGRSEGELRLSALYKKLLQDGRQEDISRMMEDAEYRAKLFAEYGME